MRIFQCTDMRIYGSTLNEIILLLLLLLLPRTPPPRRLFAPRCTGERTGTRLEHKVPMQWYKKFRVREWTRRMTGGKYGGNMAANSDGAGAGAGALVQIRTNVFLSNHL